MDLNLAQKFLAQLDGTENPLFAFRTFQDDKDSAEKDPTLTTTRYGHFSDLQDEFIRLNTKGAGIFYTVNVTDGKGFSSGNIIRVRAVFADLDGAPLEPAANFKLKPQIVVESSKGRYHCIWLIDHEKTPLALPMFEVIQTAISKRFNSDKSVKDLPRVLRLPGFYHKKKDPFLVNLVSTHDTPPRYNSEEILDAFGINVKTGKEKTLPISIPQGQRETRLVSFAGSMRRMGATESSIYAALEIENNRCVPPLEKTELLRIAHSVSKYPANSTDDFIRDKDGKIYANNQQNIKIALNKMSIHVTYDEFSERELLQYEDGTIVHLEDKTADAIWLEMDEAFRFRPSYEFFDKVIKNICHKNKFHPVKDYLNSLKKWDGVPRLEQWLIKYGGAEDSEYTRTVGKIILIAAVKRIMKPGCKFDEMLVLESPQGMEKSSALEALCPDEEWFCDDLPLNAESKKVIEQTQGKWIMEAAELSGMRKSDIEHLKSFLSRRIDTARMSYDRYTSERARQFIVIGTTNSDQYLKDTTGNRRYWPVKVSKFKSSELKKDRDKIWAEAVQLEAAGESIRLPERLWPVAQVHQEQRTHEDPWFTTIAQCIGDVTGRIFTDDVWKIVGMHDVARRTQGESIRLSEAMRKLEFEKGNIREGKIVKRGFIKGETKEEQQQRIIIEIDEDGHPIAKTASRAYAATHEWEKQPESPTQQDLVQP